MRLSLVPRATSALLGILAFGLAGSQVHGDGTEMSSTKRAEKHQVE